MIFELPGCAATGVATRSGRTHEGRWANVWSISEMQKPTSDAHASIVGLPKSARSARSRSSSRSTRSVRSFLSVAVRHASGLVRPDSKAVRTAPTRPEMSLSAVVVMRPPRLNPTPRMRLMLPSRCPVFPARPCATKPGGRPYRGARPAMRPARVAVAARSPTVGDRRLAWRFHQLNKGSRC